MCNVLVWESEWNVIFYELICPYTLIHWYFGRFCLLYIYIVCIDKYLYQILLYINKCFFLILCVCIIHPSDLSENNCCLCQRNVLTSKHCPTLYAVINSRLLLVILLDCSFKNDAFMTQWASRSYRSNIWEVILLYLLTDVFSGPKLFSRRVWILNWLHCSLNLAPIKNVWCILKTKQITVLYFSNFT